MTNCVFVSLCGVSIYGYLVLKLLRFLVQSNKFIWTYELLSVHNIQFRPFAVNCSSIATVQIFLKYKQEHMYSYVQIF